LGVVLNINVRVARAVLNKYSLALKGGIWTLELCVARAAAKGAIAGRHPAAAAEREAADRVKFCHSKRPQLRLIVLKNKDGDLDQ
jgi:hypothetical protein